jgi:hypothetical protein
MKSLLRSLRPVRYRSTILCESATVPGATFTIRRMSLGRRIELAHAIRDLAQELEFHQAGESVPDQVEAASLSARIDQIYLCWGLVTVSGLRIDGNSTTANTLYAVGPEMLLREIVDRIKSECGLSDDERKN